MEQRAILAIALSIAFFVGWNYFMVKNNINPIPFQESVQKNITDTTEESQQQQNQQAKTRQQPVQKYEQRTIREDLPQSLTVDQDANDIKDIEVHTNLMHITLTNQGALIKNLRLKKYLDDQHQPLDIVMHSEGNDLPLSIELSDPDMSIFINTIVLSTSANSLLISDTNPKETLSFQYKDTYGLSISKTLTFYHDQYHIDVRTTIEGGSFLDKDTFYRIFWGPGIYSGLKEKDRYSYEGATTFLNDDPVNNEPGDVTDPIVHQGDMAWTALQNKFFAAAFLPKDTSSKAVIKKGVNETLSAGLQYTISGGKTDNEFVLFAGPKEFDRMQSYNVKLERLIDYGIFQFIARPLFLTLKTFYRFFHNYGVSIIILTVLIKMIFLPLSQKSYKSMDKMKKLQPQIKLMQDRYKDDKQKLNEEMMRFYKENKVNPLGGCLPMVIQVPVFFALYNVLLHSVELRHAPFMLWIQDLSVKDPFYVTPILMGITMVIQQRMTPSTGDPTQAKIMMFMPIIFTAMFLNFPVGLVIYWLVNNLMTIGQQYLIAKKA